MSSKLDYLKKYMSKGELGRAGGKGKAKKKKKKKLKASADKRGGNLAIVDDDVDWRALVPADKAGSSGGEDDPDDKPTVAEMRDETVMKWQPLGGSAGRGERGDDGVGRREQSPDISPPRHPRNRHDSPDNSPPRYGRRDSPNLSPPRAKSRSVQSLNASPPRARVRHDSPDISPPRRARHDSPDDLSPPRRTAKSPLPRVSSKNTTTSVERPRKQRHDSLDVSPPRKQRHASLDMSPPRRTRHDTPDLSPPRLGGGAPDLSPPRKKSRWDKKRESDSRREEEAQSVRRPASPTRVTAGKKTGLQTADVLREENAETRRREREQFRTMDPSVSGQGAETVYRDKQGRKINPKLEKLKKMQEEKKKMEEEEKFMEWGKGVATLRMAEDKIKDELYEMSKPLARYADDEDLERMLKERERDGDPMLKFMKKKKPKLTPGGKPKKERPTFKGSFPPNRFGIRPGYRWDGVARSNGFEKAWFSQETNKKVTADMAYKWSVENM